MRGEPLSCRAPRSLLADLISVAGARGGALGIPQLVSCHCAGAAGALLAMKGFRRAVFAGVLFAAACSNGGSNDDASPPPAPLQPALHGQVRFGDAQHLALGGEEVVAVDADGNEWARGTLGRGGQILLRRADWQGFVGSVQAVVEVATPSGVQSVHLARDIDLGQAGAARPFCWLGPVSTIASRYRLAHPGVTIAAAEELAATQLGVPTTGDEHSDFGDTHRSPFSWTQFVADAGATSIDAALDAVVAEIGAAAPRRHRRPHPYPALHEAIYGGRLGAGDEEAFGGNFGSWLMKGVLDDAHFELSASTAGWAISRLGLFNSTEQEITEAIEAIQEDIAQLQAAAVSSTYQTAWQNTVQTVNPACIRIATVNSQWGSYLTPGTASAQQAALALRNYNVQLGGGMLQDLNTISDALVGRLTPNGPLASIYAAHLMQERLGVQSPSKDLLYLDLRSNALLDEVRETQDYYLGHLLLSMHLQMEWANLDPFTFPITAGSGNPMASRLELLRQIAFGQPYTSPPRPGVFADIVAAQQLVPPSTIGSDDILIDCATGGPALYWHTAISYQYSVQDAQAALASQPIGPWPAGAFRLPTLDELQQLHGRAKAAGDGDVGEGLRRLGFTNLPESLDYFDAFAMANMAANCAQFWLYRIAADGCPGNCNSSSSYTLNQPPANGPAFVNALAVFAVRNAPSGDDPTNANDFSDDPGTTIVCANPFQLSGAGIADLGADFTVMKARDPGTVGTQTVRAVTAVGASGPQTYSTRSRLVWRPDPATSPFAVGNGPDDPSVPFLRFLSAAPTGDLVGELYTGYAGTAGSVGNLRAAPLQVRYPIAALIGQPGVPPVAAPTLASVMAVPRGIVFANPVLQPFVDCIATGFYRDSSNAPALVRDHSTSGGGATVTWSVSSPSGLAAFSAQVPNRLLLQAAQGTETMTITVSVTVAGVTVTDTATCYTTF